MNTRTNKTVLLITLMICLATAVYSAVGTFTFRTSGASDTTEVVDLRYPQKVPEDSSVTTDSIADGSITNDKLAEPVSVANGGTGKTTAAEGLAALGGASLNGSSTVDFLTEDINVSGGATFSGFVKLGEAATGIKMKMLTGTTGNTQGSELILNHGLTSSKIISVQVMIRVGLGDDSAILPQDPNAGYSYSAILAAFAVYIRLSATNSENLLEKNAVVVILYKE